MRTEHVLLLVLVGVCLFFSAGCRSIDEYRKERAEIALMNLEQSRLKKLPSDKVFTLSGCINIALKHNLDLKVNELQIAVARENRTAEMLGMLPDLNTANTLTARSNEPGASSRQLTPAGLTFGPSQSANETINNINVDLVLSAVDFGLAYCKTIQSNDRMLLREQQRRRAGQNLTLDVVRAYFKVAAAQRAIGITKKLLERCRTRTKLIEKLGRSGQISPFRMFDENRRFVNLEKRLVAYIRTYEVSCVELRALLGYLPNADIKVDDSVLDKEPDFYMPSVKDLEHIALLQRPELFEIDIQRHIAEIESTKSILMMFPNVRIFVDFTNNNNNFLFHQSWWELGIRATYNLLKLPQQIAKYKAINRQIDVAKQRTWALAIGIVSQVRIAKANMQTIRERYDINKRVYKTYKTNRDFARANMRATGALSQLEMDRIELETAETQVDCLVSLSECYVAYYRVLNTMGIRNLDKKGVEQTAAEMRSAHKRVAEKIKILRAQFAKEEALKKNPPKQEIEHDWFEWMKWWKEENKAEAAVEPIAQKDTKKQDAAKPTAEKKEKSIKATANKKVIKQQKVVQKIKAVREDKLSWWSWWAADPSEKSTAEKHDKSAKTKEEKISMQIDDKSIKNVLIFS